ncbi:MAG: hypothetical protein IID16_11910 [Candidatus Marinimicrobia bacterium]|nr:hypothetical protein [Candidatus Neomarinimicrobiota bacterium]
MIHIINQKATQQQVSEMLEELDPLIKLAVDIRRNILAGGGPMHVDCEGVLIQSGSRQEDIWGANWISATLTVGYEALINIRPNQQNFSMTIQDPTIRQKVETVVRQLLEEL